MITELGATLLVANYLIAFILLHKLGDGNAPEHRPVTSLRSLVVGRVFFTVMLAIMSMTPVGGPFSFVNLIASAVHSLGAGYFILSLALDMVVAAAFSQLEFHKAFTIVLANLPSIPFVTAAASFVAWGEQSSTIRRIRKDVEMETKYPTAVLGIVSKSVRLIEQPVRAGPSDVQVKTHIVIRNIPGKIEFRYAPTVEGRVFNPHMVIAGLSGSGKTTTTYSLVTQLMENYPMVLFDVKGDFTAALYSDGFVDSGKAVIYMVSHAGIDPFKPVVEGESEPQMVEDLMDSISVLEEVGSKQAHFIRAAYGELRAGEKRLTYESLLEKMGEYEKEIMQGRLKYGPQTKDAIEGIYDKLYDLGAVFKSSGASLAELYSPLLDGKPRVVVLNIADISEKARAIVLEFMLRKLAKIMSKRGPLAFTSEKPVVTVIDEAYLVTKPIMVRGGRDSGSRSKLEDIARTGRSYGLALIIVTQRLSDIADGIRQSCYRWVVFNTSSPEDLWILSQTSPESIKEVISDLEKGEAYIRFVVPARQRTLSRQGQSRVIVEGYIFKMRRELLAEDGGQRTQLRWCTTCGRVLTSDGRCLGDHRGQKTKPASSTDKASSGEASGDKASEDLEKTGDADAGDEAGESRGKAEKEVKWISTPLLARRLAANAAKDPETKRALNNIPDEVVIRFCNDWKDKEYRQLFHKYGLLGLVDGKPKRTILGNILLKKFEEELENER